MKNNEWFRELLRERFRKTRHILHPLRTLVLFNLVFLLVYGFVIDEKPYLYAADVSPDGTKIAFSSMEEGNLWCYSSDGTLRFTTPLPARKRPVVLSRCPARMTP